MTVRPLSFARPRATRNFRRSCETRQLRLEPLEDRRLLSVFAVTNTLDSGAGSLRQAILNANATVNSGGPDRIEFAIPGTTLQTIRPASALPTITDPVVIDGYTQPGSHANTLAVGSDAVLQIELDGSAAGSSANGLWITAGQSTVRGLVINRFAASGIVLDWGDGNVLEGNIIGTNAAGTTAAANGANGVLVTNGSLGNRIGTDGNAANDTLERNLLSGNTGSGIVVETGGDNVIAGNYIGTSLAGTADLGNAQYGVLVTKASQRNRIGTDANGVSDDLERNVVSGNGLAGVEIGGLIQTELSTPDTPVNDGSTALDEYVAAKVGYIPPSSTPASVIDGPGYTVYVYDLVSQTWDPQGYVYRNNAPYPQWHHWLQIYVPDTLDTSLSTAFLYVGGGGISSTPPTTLSALRDDAKAAASAITQTGSICVFLPCDPNESLQFADEMSYHTEDEIVAYTFDKFLKNYDTSLATAESWPSYLAMVNSAVRAMDAVQALVPGLTNQQVNIADFVITGASKRGWTTELTTAVDPQGRVKAMIPMVADLPNLGKQMEHQKAFYEGLTSEYLVDGQGHRYSQELNDYLHYKDAQGNTVIERLFSTAGQALLGIVDPFAYRDRDNVKVPQFYLFGAMDQFFVPGSAEYYIHAMQERAPTYLRYVPNAGHDLERYDVVPGGDNSADALASSANFYAAILAGAALPTYDWTIQNDGHTIDLTTSVAPSAVYVWQATNPTERDFRMYGESDDPVWAKSPLAAQSNGHYVTSVATPASGAAAFMIEVHYLVNGKELTFTSSVSVVSADDANVVRGNYIGTDVAGTGALGNGTQGVLIDNCNSTLVAANVISANGADGVQITGPDAQRNILQRNFIGTNASGTASLGNVGNGVAIQNGASSNAIGSASAGNTIAYNGGAGILVTGSASLGNRIQGNLVFLNGSLAIDLAGNGPTANDAGDTDTGPNGLQNYPVLTFVEPGTTSHAYGTINSTPNTTFTIDFYAGNAQTSGYVGAQRYLGSTTVTTGADGNATIDVTGAVLTSPGEWITATATDPAGNTSELSLGTIAAATTPVVHAGDDTTLPEGALGIRLGSFDDEDPTETAFTATVDYGDGSGPAPLALQTDKTFQFQHTFADNGTYTVVVTVTDVHGNIGTDSFQVLVTNVAPSLTLSGNSSANLGDAYTLNLASSDPGTDTISQWQITWGDGDVQTVTGNPSSVQHTYASIPATYTISATASDEDGTYAAGNQLTVSVVNLVRSRTLSGAPSVAETDPYTLNLAASGPGSDTISQWQITWDDGSIQTVAGNPSSVQHIYADGPASYTISATATDAGGTYAADNQLQVAVNNLAPTAAAISSLSDGYQGVRGQLRTFTLSATDPSSIDQAGLFTYTINWGDGSAAELLTGPASATATHAFSSAGTFQVSVTATDKDGATSLPSASLPVTILSVEQQGSSLVVGGTTGNDSFTISQTTVTGQVTLVLNATSLGTFTLPSANTVRLLGLAGTDTAAITARTTADTLRIDGATMVANEITTIGDSIEAWQLNALGGDDTLTLVSGTATVDGGAGTDTLIGPAASNSWQLTAAGAGTLNGALVFSNLENLTGGSQDDTFRLAGTASVAGKIDGAAGSDLLDYSSYSSAVAVNLASLTATGTAGIANLERLSGSSSSDTLTGSNSATTWHLTGAKTGDVNGTFSFQAIENLTGGTAADRFQFQDAASGFATINGGSGTDVLDYSPSTGPVSVNLATAAASKLTSFSAIESLQGSASQADTLTGPNAATTFTINAASGGTAGSTSFAYFENLTGGSGDDTFKLSGTGSLAGAIDGGSGTNVLDYSLYTVNGTGVSVNLQNGTATGIGTGASGKIANVTVVIGTASIDTLVGNTLANILIGGAGADTIYGGDGRDLLIGGTGADIVHGENGEDILIGGATTYYTESTRTLNLASLKLIMAEWTRTDLGTASDPTGYLTRVSHLLNGKGLNGNTKLNNKSVLKDSSAVDQLFGEADRDWFLASSEDATTDRVTSGTTAETRTSI